MLFDDKKEDIFKILFPYSDENRASDHDMIDTILTLCRDAVVEMLRAKASKLSLAAVEQILKKGFTDLATEITEGLWVNR